MAALIFAELSGKSVSYLCYPLPIAHHLLTMNRLRLTAYCLLLMRKWIGGCGGMDQLLSFEQGYDFASLPVRTGLFLGIS
jgi:hypothetical protein